MLSSILEDSENTKITQLELLMVFQAVMTFPEAFKDTTGVYFVIDSAAKI